MMNRQAASKLKLSELEYFDDLNQEYKTYTFEDVEYKLFGSLSQARLEGESQEEYKVRRIFMAERLKNRGTMVWNSKNNENLKYYNLVRRLPVKEGEDNTALLDSIKETTIRTNLGTYNKKKVEAIVNAIKQESIVNE